MLTNCSAVLLPFTMANSGFENPRMTLSNLILARADGTWVPLTAISGGVRTSVKPDKRGLRTSMLTC